MQTSVRKQQNRPTRFKLAYVQKASNRDKVGFGIKSCKNAKIYRKKSDDKFWESICIPNYVHFHDLHIFKEIGE